MIDFELWFVRHGQSDYNLLNKVSGWSDARLTDLGREQARSLRSFIKQYDFDSVWSSDLQRAIDTARLAYGDAKPDKRLREIYLGDLEGIASESVHSDIKKAWANFADFQAPQGESVSQVCTRVNQFFNELKKGRHLLFTHGGVIRTIMLQIGSDYFTSNGSIVAIDWKARQRLFVYENELATQSTIFSSSI